MNNTIISKNLLPVFIVLVVGVAYIVLTPFVSSRLGQKKHFEQSQAHFCFDYPKSWTSEEFFQDGKGVVLFDPRAMKEGVTRNNITVLHDGAYVGFASSEIPEFQKELPIFTPQGQLDNMLAGGTSVLRSQKDITVDGERGILAEIDPQKQNGGSGLAGAADLYRLDVSLRHDMTLYTFWGFFGTERARQRLSKQFDAVVASFQFPEHCGSATDSTNVSFDELMSSLVTATPPPDGSGSGRVAVIQRGNPETATPIGSVPMKGAPAILGDYLLFPYDSGNSAQLLTPYLLDRSGTKTVLTQFAANAGLVSGVAATDGTLAVSNGKKLVIYSAVLSEQASFAPTDIANQATDQASFLPLAFSQNSQMLYTIVNFTDTSAGGCGVPHGLYEIDLTTKKAREIDQAPECASASSPDRRVIAAVAPTANVALEDIGSTSSVDAQTPSHTLRLISLSSGETVYEMRATADTNWDGVQQAYVQAEELALSLAPRPSASNGFFIMNLENHNIERHSSPDSLVHGWAGSNFVVLWHTNQSILVYDRIAKEIKPVLTVDDIDTYQFVGFFQR